ncbi:hypothetical protein ABZX62_20325 [Streptomyces flavidovirens]|uniref:hypothetical protein n=1 Tax=Streptomyces flavidovirens TaxID=67298 RepID=UPI0033BD1847
MDPNVASGLIGFGGAVVGAGAAIFGTWIQQRHQAHLAKEERDTARQDAAFDTAVQAVFAAKDLFRRRQSGIAEDDWKHQLSGELDRLRLATLSLSSAEVRRRLVQVAEMLMYWERLVPFGAGTSEKYRAVREVIDDTLDALGEYRRTGTIPMRSGEFSEALGWLDEWVAQWEDEEGS